MNEWGVVGVIVSLVGLFFVVYSPISKAAAKRSEERLSIERDKTLSTKENTEAMTRLTLTMENLAGQFDSLKADNADSHRRIWEKNNEQDEALNRHETRITVLEKKGEKHD
ncbi:MAG: hypothetical protein RSE36_06385 [Oscillospiraceae bacterium]